MSTQHKQQEASSNQKLKRGIDGNDETTDWRHTINWELIYKVISLCVIVLVPFFIADVLKFRKYNDEHNHNYVSWSFCFYALVSAGVLALYRNVFATWLLYDFVFNNIAQKYQGLDREVRAKKVVKWLTDIFYYGATTIYAIIFFGHTKWFPLILKNDYYSQDFTENWPSKPSQGTFELEFFLCVQFGQHIYALLELVVVRRKLENKFYEWFLHHILAFTLIFYAVYNNFLVSGSTILVIHDIGDIFLAWFKVYGVFRTDFLFYINTFNMIISWFISRIYIYPKGIILPLIADFNMIYNEQVQKPYMDYTKACYIYMVILIIILQIMHIYWFATMLTMLGSHLKKIVSSSNKVKFQNDFDFHKKPIDDKSKKE